MHFFLYLCALFVLEPSKTKANEKYSIYRESHFGNEGKE